jgi:hypothetical protein
VISCIFVKVLVVYKCGGHGVHCCAGENGGVVDGRRSSGTDDSSEVRKEAEWIDDGGSGCGAYRKQDSGEGKRRIKDIGSSDVGTVFHFKGCSHCHHQVPVAVIHVH